MSTPGTARDGPRCTWRCATETPRQQQRRWRRSCRRVQTCGPRTTMEASRCTWRHLPTRMPRPRQQRWPPWLQQGRACGPRLGVESSLCTLPLVPRLRASCAIIRPESILIAIGSCQGAVHAPDWREEPTCRSKKDSRAEVSPSSTLRRRTHRCLLSELDLPAKSCSSARGAPPHCGETHPMACTLSSRTPMPAPQLAARRGAAPQAAAAAWQHSCCCSTSSSSRSSLGSLGSISSNITSSSRLPLRERRRGCIEVQAAASWPAVPGPLFMMGDGFDRDRLRDSKTQVQPSGFLQFPLREVDAGGDLRRTPPLVRCAPGGVIHSRSLCPSQKVAAFSGWGRPQATCVATHLMGPPSAAAAPLPSPLPLLLQGAPGGGVPRAQPADAVHRRQRDPLWLVLPVHCQGASQLEPGGRVGGGGGATRGHQGRVQVRDPGGAGLDAAGARAR